MKYLFPIILSIGLTLAVAITPGAQPRASAGPVNTLSTQIDIAGPPGSELFGYRITTLPNGNFVVADPYYDSATATNVGAVYLYDGATGSLLSALTGSTTDDQFSSDVIALSNGNYVVRSPYWDNGAVTNAGAVTWCSGVTGCTGVITITNSLVGSSPNDYVGIRYVTALADGDYVVRCPEWDNGATADAGAVTWCSGTSGCTGVVTTTNSLVGSQTGDCVGGEVTMLSNDSYVVTSYSWNNGTVTDAGAVTWCSGTGGCTGPVTPANSLVGSQANDQVGSDVFTLSNGSYVVSSSDWDNGTVTDAGAVTWCSGASGCTGPVTPANSLVGYTTEDRVGSGNKFELNNGSYVVTSYSWNNGAEVDAGAVTWCSGTGGCTGVVTITNSLVGSHADDRVGYHTVARLSDGSYVVSSPEWDNGATYNVGAATWCSGATGCTGVVTTTNSLVGSQAGDRVGHGGVTVLEGGRYVVSSSRWNNGPMYTVGAVTWCSGAPGCTGVVTTTNSLIGATDNDMVGYSINVLEGGNYVVRSPYWDNGATANAGAVTWCSGTSGCTGVVTVTNSLVGSQADDQVGGYDGNVIALKNGSYVVSTSYWDNGTVTDAGAVTWCSGAVGCTGPVTVTNSLVGSQADDQVGSKEVIELSNGNYVVSSPGWRNGTVTDAGAVTWCSGASGCTGVVTTTNSLVGSSPSDYVGIRYVTALSNGSYVVPNTYWDNGSTANAGAVTWCSGPTGCAGPITADNSVRGTAAGGGGQMNFAHDPVNVQLVVGRPKDNVVTLFRPYQRVFVPFVMR